MYMCGHLHVSEVGSLFYSIFFGSHDMRFANASQSNSDSEQRVGHKTTPSISPWLQSGVVPTYLFYSSLLVDELLHVVDMRRARVLIREDYLSRCQMHGCEPITLC